MLDRAVPSDAVTDVIRGVYHHPTKLEQISERGWEVIGFEGGRAI